MALIGLMLVIGRKKSRQRVARILKATIKAALASSAQVMPCGVVRCCRRIAIVAGKLTKCATRNNNAIPINPPRSIFTTGDCKSVFFFVVVVDESAFRTGVAGGVCGSAPHEGRGVETSCPGNGCVGRFMY